MPLKFSRYPWKFSSKIALTCVVVFSISKVVSTSKSPIPSTSSKSFSTWYGSFSTFPNIWYPPQIPIINLPLLWSSFIWFSKPFFLKNIKSSIVDFVPGIITISGSPKDSPKSTYLKLTSSWVSNILKSVKLDIWGVLTTSICISPLLIFCLNLVVTLSSSSIFISV